MFGLIISGLKTGLKQAMMRNPELTAAAQAFHDNDLAKAEALVRTTLTKEPENAEALKLLARIAVSTGFTADAEQLLRKAIAIDPALVEANADLASLLCSLGRVDEALSLLDHAIKGFPDAVWPLSLKAAVLDAERRTDEVLGIHEQLVSCAGHAAIPWLNYGHALRAVGRTDDAAGAYRKSLQIDPGNGFAWWGLANLRLSRLGSDDIVLLERALSTCPDTLQRVQLHFAMGRVLGDHGRYEESFHHYERANRLRQKLSPYDARATQNLILQSERDFTAEFLSRRASLGCDASGPIFIVGMPRSGTTLVEQILASHPMVEGCGELFQISNIAARLADRKSPPSDWIDTLAKLDTRRLQALGQQYLASAQRHRRLGCPFFVDKMPSNWKYLGLIHLILPQAKIVAVRRDPLANCLSAFSTYFNRETEFPTSLKDLGHHYSDHIRMIAHFDAKLPGRIHHVQYEHLLADLEGEVRRLLDYLTLPFDTACLRFHENPRAIYTPSAEQVRRPISGEGLERWRRYEPWLTPLKEALGSLFVKSDGPVSDGVDGHRPAPHYAWVNEW